MEEIKWKIVYVLRNSESEVSYSLSDREGKKDGVPEREPPKKQANLELMYSILCSFVTRTVYAMRWWYSNNNIQHRRPGIISISYDKAVPHSFLESSKLQVVKTFYEPVLEFLNNLRGLGTE